MLSYNSFESVAFEFRKKTWNNIKICKTMTVDCPIRMMIDDPLMCAF